MAIRIYFLHKAFPDLVGPDYTLRAVNYILGTHPVSSTSYVAGVGTV
jgi:endoglucanase